MSRIIPGRGPSCWTFYNTRADDGVSYVDKPARSLIVSWKQLMRRLAKVMHDAGKVVYVNNHGKRLDLLEGVDGFFDEFTYASAALNTTALLGLHKPVMGWLSDAKQMTPDPHRFMQRFLYMGAYPMTPFPDNDHSVTPTPEIEGYYLAYAPLFQQLLGKKWVLDCGVHRVEGALANIFETDAGYVIPVVYGESDEARVSLQLDCVGDTARIYHPGSNEGISREIHSCGQGGRREIQAPLKDGCALILLNSVRGTEPVSP